MKFDSRALLQVAQTAGVPEDTITTVLASAIKDAYDATPGAVPGVQVTLDTAAGEIHLTAPDGTEVAAPGFGARALTAARQAVVSWMRDLDRRRQVGPWADREGTPVRAVVKSLTRTGDYRLDVDGVMAILPAGEDIPHHPLNPGQEVTVLLLAANVTDQGTVKLTVSRRQPALVVELFNQKLAQTGTDTTIVSIAREPGVRTKVACTGSSPDPRQDLIGPAGTTARSVTSQLDGERIDILTHDADLAQYVTNALSPAVVEKVEVLDPQRRIVVAHVREDELATAQGTGGVNLRLASRLTATKITLATS